LSDNIEADPKSNGVRICVLELWALLTTVMKRGIFGLAEWLSASEEVLYFMELFGFSCRGYTASNEAWRWLWKFV